MSYPDDSLSTSSESDGNFQDVPVRKVHRKKNRKILSTFAMALVKLASESDWENHALGDLVHLIVTTLDFSVQDVLKFLTNCDLISPTVLSQLKDNHGMKLLGKDLVIFWSDNSESNSEFISTIDEAIEQELIDLGDNDLLQMIHDTSQAKLTSSQFSELVRTICGHLETKRHCGRLLKIFVQSMQETEAANFIADLTTFDFFEDLRGSLESFLGEVRDIRSLVLDSLAASKRASEASRDAESDEDENGNLKDFVVGEDEIELDSEQGSNSESDNEDDEVDEEKDDEVMSRRQMSLSRSPPRMLGSHSHSVHTGHAAEDHWPDHHEASSEDEDDDDEDGDEDGEVEDDEVGCVPTTTTSGSCDSSRIAVLRQRILQANRPRPRPRDHIALSPAPVTTPVVEESPSTECTPSLRPTYKRRRMIVNEDEDEDEVDVPGVPVSVASSAAVDGEEAAAAVVEMLIDLSDVPVDNDSSEDCEISPGDGQVHDCDGGSTLVDQVADDGDSPQIDDVQSEEQVANDLSSDYSKLGSCGSDESSDIHLGVDSPDKGNYRSRLPLRKKRTPKTRGIRTKVRRAELN